MQQFVLHEPFFLEEGGALEQLVISYCTYGRLSENRDNVVWICHALTANADAEKWWPSMVGKDACFDTEKYFIVCANIIGSCYGTTGPLSISAVTGQPYFDKFPFITIRDMVKAHQLLCRHLDIKKIQLLAGGSMGGYQALEWCVMEPALISQLFLIATSAKETAWGKAIHTTQRMAIETDNTWKTPAAEAGKNGLKVARGIGMIAYRGYETYCATQEDEQINNIRNYKASSYIHYQGEKFSKRFNAYSYWYLTHAMDSHNIARGRSESMEAILQMIKQKVLILGINSDILCPLAEQMFLAKHIKNARFAVLNSLYGHDGFLVETAAITKEVSVWMREG